MKVLRKFISEYKSAYWMGKPYRLVDTNIDIGSGNFIREEIAQKIEDATFTIVILDGLRHNVLFELGYLYSSKKPFILLKHRYWGPRFIELELAASDLKGIIVKEFDHENHGKLHQMLESELRRCEKEFLLRLGTHSILPMGGDNLVSQDWAFQDSDWKEIRDGSRECIELTSGKAVDLPIRRQISKSSLLIVQFDLPRPDSGLTVYLYVCFRKNEEEKKIWFGYSSGSTGAHLYRSSSADDILPAEITIPIDVSGLGSHLLVDNILQMIVQRLGGGKPGRTVVERIRLRGRTGSITNVRRVLITH